MLFTISEFFTHSSLNVVSIGEGSPEQALAVTVHQVLLFGLRQVEILQGQFSCDLFISFLTYTRRALHFLLLELLLVNFDI